MIIRENRIGLRYQLTPAEGGTLAVLLSKPTKTVFLNATLNQINQAWYNWQVKGEYIQTAFNFLPVEQREFLLSGITPSEWNEIFKEEEE